MEKIVRKSKPRKCPNCGSKKIARILFGYPIFTRKLERDVKNRKIVLGGCDVTDDDPEWLCISCKAEIFKDSGIHEPNESIRFKL